MQQTLTDYQSRVETYIAQQHPNATIGDVLGKKEIVVKDYPYLLGTLPYKTAVKGSSFTVIPDTLRHKLSFQVKNDTVDLTLIDPDAPDPLATSLILSKSLPELAGKKITLSYAPATAADEAVINSYLPKPHADGTPIQPSEVPSRLPAYLIKVKPELRIAGQVVATGAPIGLGGTNIFTLTFSGPVYGTQQIVNTIDAGVYQAIGLNLGRISPGQLTSLKANLEATKSKLETGNFAALTKDDLVGDLLYTTALAYHAEFDTTNFLAARTMGVNAITLPSETIFATTLKVMCLWGIPRYVSAGGLMMDADHLANVVIAKDGNDATEKQYMLSSGMTSSALEHSVPEQLFSTPENPVEAISAVKALQLANDQGIPIYTVTKDNLATVLPQLQVSAQVKTDIQNAINAGKVVTVSKSNINFKGWIGCGYIVTNPESGAGAYMISGGLSGSVIDLAFDLLWGALFFASFFVGLMGGPIGVAIFFAALGILNSVAKNYAKTGNFELDAWKEGRNILIGGVLGAIFNMLFAQALFLTVAGPVGWAFAIAACVTLLIVIGLSYYYSFNLRRELWKKNTNVIA